jgi:predicted HTH domain antitoxin
MTLKYPPMPKADSTIQLKFSTDDLPISYLSEDVFSINIPEEILESIKIPRDQIKKEFAFFLYEKNFASMGTARKLADLTKWEFIEGLSQRNIARHYYEKELEEDLGYAKGEQ